MTMEQQLELIKSSCQLEAEILTLISLLVNKGVFTQKEFEDKYGKMLNALIGQIGEKFDGDEKFLWNFIARGIFDGGDHDH